MREMLIQHILTEEIFANVFDNGDFHRENNIAKELYALEAKFFTGAVKRETLKALETYYATIRANAALITSHQEKQNFLKVIYENFYKVYNQKAADRLGVVYTPNEIVKFMIEGADWLTPETFRQAADRRACRNPRPGDRHRHLHLRIAGAFSRAAAESWRTNTRTSCTPTRWRSCPTTSPT